MIKKSNVKNLSYLKAKVFIVLFLVLLSSIISAQYHDKIEFKDFIECFDDLKPNSIINETGNYIPKLLIKEVVTDLFFKEIDVIYKANGIINRNNNITLVLEVIYPYDGYVSDFNILTFNTFGELINFDEIGQNTLDFDGGNKCSFYLFGDTLLEVKEEKLMQKNVDHIKDLAITSTRYKYFFVDSFGFKELNIPALTHGRKYGIISQRILRPEELEETPKLELDIMRNEIFADHGYIFKTKIWQEYFSQQLWYKPLFEDVNDKLTFIDKANIRTILMVEEKLQEKK